MVYVNRIAEIVHTIVDQHMGSANKNIGDAFLLVWKMPNWLEKKGISNPLVLSTVTQSMADLSLFSFLKIYAETNRASSLAVYTKNKKILQ
jgi:class 3 adenylate cyclase